MLGQAPKQPHRHAGLSDARTFPDKRCGGHRLARGSCWGWGEGRSRREGFTYDQIKCKYMKHNFKEGGGVGIMCTLVRIPCCSVQSLSLVQLLATPWTASGRFF